MRISFLRHFDDAIEKVDALLEDEYVRDLQTPNYTREEMRI